MIPLKPLTGALLWCCLLSSFGVWADSEMIVDHFDPIEVEPTMTLAGLIDTTAEHYPDAAWLKALEDEAKALAERGQSWIAGPATADLFFLEATSGTLHILDAVVSVPLWNFGQRDAEQNIAQRADDSRQSQSRAFKLRVGGLGRSGLWDFALTEVRAGLA